MRPALLARLSLPALCGLLGSCARRVALDEVPIVGGSPEQRAAVREGLAQFEAHAGAGRVRLGRIVFEPLEDRLLGRYDRRSDVLRLDEDLVDPLPQVLRHELCHALDFAEDLVERPSPLFDSLAGALFDPDSGLLPIDSMKTERNRRSEALARLCDIGAPALSALQARCAHEPPEVGEAADWLTRRVWREHPPLRGVGALPQPQASLHIGVFEDEPDLFSVSGLDDPDLLLVNVSVFDGERVGEVVDRETGEPWDGPLPGSFSAFEGLPRGLPLSDESHGPWAGWPEGPAAAVVSVELPPFGELRRLLASDDVLEDAVVLDGGAADVLRRLPPRRRVGRRHPRRDRRAVPRARRPRLRRRVHRPAHGADEQLRLPRGRRVRLPRLAPARVLLHQ